MNPLANRIRRIILGPTTEEINDEVLAAGGPGYPIAPVNTQAPTLTVPTGALLLDPQGPYQVAVNRQHHIDAADTIARARTDTPGDPMPDPITDTQPPIAVAHEGDAGALDPHPTSDSGVHALNDADEAALPTIVVNCTHCEGHGRMTRTVNDLLRESLGLIPLDGGDQVIKEFYARLLHAAPTLIPLFPPDLLTAATQDGASPGALQRDRLLTAVLALGENYGAGREAMTRLRTALEAFGRHHAAFARPDGTIEGATPEEYLAVRDVLFGVFVDLIGAAWRPEYTKAWARAYQFAMSVMLNAQEEYLEAHPDAMARYPRRADA